MSLCRRFASKLCLCASVMFLAATAATGQPVAASLFQPVAASAVAPHVPDTITIQERLVRLDPALEVAPLFSADRDQTAAPADNSGRLGRRVTVDLFDDVSVELQRRDVKASEDGVIWSATAPQNGYAIFVVAHHTLVGVIETAGRRFMIAPAGPGLHRLREVDVSAYPKDWHIERPEQPVHDDKASRRPETSGAETITYLDLLVAYTAKARTKMTAGGATVGQVVAPDIAVVNQGMKNSGIPVRIRRVGLQAVHSTYDEDPLARPEQPLYDITSGTTANFPAIRLRRDTVAADLVALYIDRTPTPYCGVAWLNYPVPSALYSFGVVDADCRGSVTLAHELGHTMGLFHDRYVEVAAPASQHDFGYVSTQGNFRTIMSYPNQCLDTLGHDCQRITYYSTPQKTFNGEPVGIPKGTAGAADAARWIREHKQLLSTFR